MKIGILTFQNAHNYGALLQAYALKKYLEEKGFEVEFINYINAKIEENYLKKPKNNVKIGGFRSAKKWFKTQINLLYGKTHYIEKWNKFNDFIHTYLVNEPEQYEIEKLDVQKYDFILFGSDQIWNPNLTNGFDGVYFGEFKTKAKKIAYAASLGKANLSSDELKYFGKLLENFDFISVREDELRKYIKKELGMNVKMVLDPTLLADKSIYDNFLKPVPYKKYIFQYTLMDNPELDKIVEEIAKRKNLQIIEVRYQENFFRKKGLQISNAGIQDFLSLLKGADFVVTNSFHGTIFSILFQKDFYTVKINGVNSRIENLLHITSLEDRMIENIEEVNLESKIDFKKALNNIENEKIDSKKFLENVLKA